MKVSIVIKALNEERRIAQCVESALAAVAPFGGEVVLADSCSSDRTVEIAARYPIRIVQLTHASERCCGIGPQLGFQHSQGEFVYILDGDMTMLPGFLPRALAFMDAHPGVAGVSGRLVEMNTDSLEYKGRVERGMHHMQAGEVDRLDCGGLYRRSAVMQTGYFSDRNLHSYEEYDLAARLRSRGWKLHRIDVPVAEHYGHDAPPYELLLRRWRSHYICGLGELLRGAWGQAHWPLVWAEIRELKLYVAVCAWWALLLAVWFLPGADWAARTLAFMLVLMAPVALMAWRKRSVGRGLYAVVAWCFNAAGVVRGLFRGRVPATRPIDSKVLHDAAATAHRNPT